ncbi:endothelin-converting enzyme homolog [Pollicipes pollicipes]|uniref:endothelin-converting enzyme homolog n=1 Tax=Pollicipes pollicipes TaxID=41117 RepID=UPI00188594ED|nr:endothelin-converting enzyme homolog [Pollicipes pollicipes]
MGGENGEPVAEPRERDTMLDDSVEPSKRRPGRLRWAAASLGLPLRWMLTLAVLGLLALLLLMIVIVLAASWPPPPPVDETVRCETSDCLRAAAQLRSSLAGGDDTACDSLWQHTCSSWLRDNPIPETSSQWGVTDQLLYSEERRLQRILSTLQRVDSSRSYLWKLDAFYQGCMGRAAKSGQSVLKTSLVTIINKLGGFDAVGSFERQVWNPLAVVRVLQAEHNIDCLLPRRRRAAPGRGRQHHSDRVWRCGPAGAGLLLPGS